MVLRNCDVSASVSVTVAFQIFISNSVDLCMKHLCLSRSLAKVNQNQQRLKLYGLIFLPSRSHSSTISYCCDILSHSVSAKLLNLELSHLVPNF